MKPLLTCLLIASWLNGCSQKNANEAPAADIRVGGNCEGCEAIYECPLPFASLDAVDTLPGFHGPGPKIEISGTVFKSDGKTPAGNIIMYVYHTDQQGIYPKKGDEKGWARRHGYIRGWIKTDEKGSYKFFTLLPASYPDSRNPKHIHLTVKEPGIEAYWLEDFLFEGDPYLAGERSDRRPRGGNGVVTLSDDGTLRKARRDIILGLNVAGYPAGR